MRIEALLIALLVTFLFFTGMTLWVNGLRTEYNVPSTGFNSSAFQKLDEAKNLTEEVTDTFQNSGDVSTVDALGSFAKGAFSTMMLTFASVGIVQGVGTDFSTLFGLNPIFVVGAVGVLGLLIVFAIIYAMVRVKP